MVVMEIKVYEHKTQYYETDKMGIIHHSNYIRWFEEARTDYMEQIGLRYDTMEAHGVGIPVLGISCQYKSMTRFGETVTIEVKGIQYNGIKMKLGYIIRDKKTQEIRCTGESQHCFLDEQGNPVSIKKSYHDWHAVFESMLEK